jgi:thiol-disulfide isomerase/thioredoxin
MTSDQPSLSPQPRPVVTHRLVMAVTAVLVGGVIGLAGVYGIGGLSRNASDPSCRAATELAKKLTPLIHGEVAALNPASSGLRIPDLTFQDASGATRKLSEWRGKVVLLNLWATWCVPCRKEMPALDALEHELGGPRFEVVAVNIDTRDPEKPKAWLAETGIKDLAYYADPTAKIFQDLKLIGKAFGMPTTLLLDPAGCEIASLAGPAEWASGDALTLLRAALASDTPRAAGGS